MLQLIVLIVIMTLVGGIVFVLKNGFNEVIKGLESLDDRLKTIEEKLGSK